MEYRKTKHLVFLMLTLLLAVSLIGSAFAADLSFEEKKVTIFEGEHVFLRAVQAGNAVGETVTWSSSNQKVATVSPEGEVTGVSKGTATITASCRSGSRTVKATCTVTVARAVTGIAIDDANLSLLTPDDIDLRGKLSLGMEEGAEQFPVLAGLSGKTISFKAAVEPKDATNRKITVFTSDETVAKPQGASGVKLLGTGECYVVIASESNPEVSVTFHLYVIDAKKSVKRVALSADRQTIGIGGLAQLEAVVTPDTAELPGVTFVSQDESVATVDPFGRVIGVSRGNAVIKAVAKDGSGVSGSIRITVQQQPTSIQADETLVLAVGKGTKQIKATVQPSNANNKKLTFTSSDPSVAKVNASGVVTPVSAGACIITVASQFDPNVYTLVHVAVNQPVTRIAFDEKTITVNVGETTWVSWNTEPYNATDTSVSLSSSNEKIFTVSQSGQITGVKRGEATLTVKAMDGGNARGTIKVKVLQPVLGVHMYNDTVNVGVNEDITIRAELEPSDASNTHMTWVSDDPTIATVRGTGTRPVVHGLRWGNVTITGTTEDGGFTCTCFVRVGLYNNALKITDFYTQDNVIKISIFNESNMVITRFTFTIEAYDIYDNPLALTASGMNTITGSYNYALYEGQATQHGRFTFPRDFVQPQVTIGRMVIRITGYTAADGFSWNIRKVENQPTYQFMSPLYIGAQPIEPPGELEPLGEGDGKRP